MFLNGDKLNNKDHLINWRINLNFNNKTRNLNKVDICHEMENDLL